MAQTRASVPGPSREGSGHQPSYVNAGDIRTRSIEILDHDGGKVTLGWSSLQKMLDQRGVPPFPFQVYVTNSATRTIQQDDFATSFALQIERLGGIGGFDGECSYRFEVYEPQTDILACEANQRREILWRNRNGVWPRMVEDWYRADQNGCGFSIVIDRDEWKQDGWIVVTFDLTDHPNRYPGQQTCKDPDTMVSASRVREPGKLLCGRQGLLQRWWTYAGV